MQASIVWFRDPKNICLHHKCFRFLGFLDVIILSMWAHIGIMWAYRGRTLDSHKAKYVPISGPDVPLPVHMSSTWEHIGPNAGLYGPTWAPSRPNIDPHGTNWAHTDLYGFVLYPI